MHFIFIETFIGYLKFTFFEYLAPLTVFPAVLSERFVCSGSPIFVDRKESMEL